MEQRFNKSGDQYTQDIVSDKQYFLDSSIPSGENIWTQTTKVKKQLLYDENKGLEDFHNYYASNSGVSGYYRPRPKQIQVKERKLNGIHQLFNDTQNINYSTDDGKCPDIDFPNSNDAIIQQFNVMNGNDKKENCGCGGAPLLHV